MSKLQTFIDDSIRLLKDNEDLLRKKKDLICEYLEEIFEVYNVTIIGRVKSEKSLREKIIRNNYYNKFGGDSQKLFNELSDMVGIRINCLLTREEDENFSILKKRCKRKNDDKYNYYIEDSEIYDKFYIDLDSKQPQTQKNGKDIYRIDAKYKDSDIEFNIEIQIKSSINSLWGEIDHKLFYKNYEYLLSQDFYSGLMKLLYDNLDSVEKQLELLKDHMEGTSDNLEESQEILARLLYNTYNNECKNIALNCIIDFRSICKLVAQLYFNIPSRHFNMLNQSIDLIKSTSCFLYKESQIFVIDNEEYNFYDEITRKLADCIQNLIGNENVYWRTFINIYSIINQKIKYTDALMEMSKQLIKSIHNTVNQASVDTNDMVNSNKINIIKMIVSEQYIKYLRKTKKVELFLKKNLSELHDFMLKFISLNISFFSDENEEEFDDSMRKALSIYIDFILVLVNERVINLDTIRELIIENIFYYVEENEKTNLKVLFDDYEKNVNVNTSIKRIIDLLAERSGVSNDEE